jgi:hypothetical protein
MTPARSTSPATVYYDPDKVIVVAAIQVGQLALLGEFNLPRRSNFWATPRVCVRPYASVEGKISFLRLRYFLSSECRQLFNFSRFPYLWYAPSPSLPKVPKCQSTKWYFRY